MIVGIFRDVSVSSSVSSSSNSEKTSFSCVSLGGGDDPCAIWLLFLISRVVACPGSMTRLPEMG